MSYAGKHIGTIERHHLIDPRPFIGHQGRRYYLRDVIGQVLASDIGKQVWLHEGVVQVENNQQHDQRIEREVEQLRKAWADAESDVHADMPDAEAGWENDVIRSVCQLEEVSGEAKAEFCRTQGVRWP